MTMIGLPVRPLCRRVTTLLFAAVILLLLMVRMAAAHAVLISSSPAQGERLGTVPAIISLRFSEAVTRIDLTLVGKDDAPIRLQPRIEDTSVVADLDPQLPDGVYALNWKVLSEDGHPVSAAVVFAVGSGGDLGTALSASHAQTPHAWLTWGAKAAFYVTSLFGIGAAFFARWVTRRQPAIAVLICLIAAGIFGLCQLALLGLELADKPLSALVTAEPWRLAVGTSLARSMALVSTALFLAIVGCLERRFSRFWTLASLALIGPAYALTGHASAAGPFSFAAVALHIAGVCFWLGALPGLWRLMRSSGAAETEALSLFSAMIPISIAAIIGAGGYLAYVQIGSIAALLSTAYGKVFLVKLLLVCLTLLLGLYNRLRLTPAVERGDVMAARRMRAIIGVEILLVILVLAVTSLWRFTPPPRALALRPPITASVHMHMPTAMATVSLEGQPGETFRFEVSVATGDFDPLDPKEVTLRLSSVIDGTIAPFEVPLQHRSAGLWSADKIPLPPGTDWKVRVDLLVSDFDLVTLEDVLILPPD